MRHLKGTDWMQAPCGFGYYKDLGDKRVYIRKGYTYSASGKEWGRRYKVSYDTGFAMGYIGYKSTFKQAMELAEGGK